jgi:hypothetical protein
MHRMVKFLLLLTILGCSQVTKTSRPATIPQPDLDAGLAHSVFFGSSSTAPATVDVFVGNRASVPITVRRIEIDSPGMGEYTLLHTVREFRETIPAGQSKTLTVFATAQTTVRRPTEPLLIRAVIEFEAGEGPSRWREVLMARGGSI